MISNNLIVLFILLIIIIVIYLIKGLYQPEMEPPYWHRHLEKQLSTQEFYGCIEDLLISKEIPGLKMYRIVRQEGGLFSANREYLRIKRKEIVIDVCGFTFGNGFCVSCRKGCMPNSAKKSSQRDSIWEIVFTPKTFYHDDSETAFKSFVNHSIEEAVRIMNSGIGLRNIEINSKNHKT
jgi:hypothetical protein